MCTIYFSPRVQLISYSRSGPECSLNLALFLCETIYPELPHLPEKIRSLNLLYVIEVASGTVFFSACSKPSYPSYLTTWRSPGSKY